MYKSIEWVLKSDAKAEYTQQINLVGSYNVRNFTMEMATNCVHFSKSRPSRPEM